MLYEREKYWGVFTKCILYLTAWLSYLDRKPLEYYRATWIEGEYYDLEAYNEYNTLSNSINTTKKEYERFTYNDVFSYDEIIPFRIISFFRICYNIHYLPRYKNIIIKAIIILMYVIFDNKLSRCLMNKYSQNHMIKNEHFYLEEVIGEAKEISEEL